jgi:hypothetical protein
LATFKLLISCLNCATSSRSSAFSVTCLNKKTESN